MQTPKAKLKKSKPKKKMGRPPLPPGEKRQTFTFRLNHQLVAQFRAFAKKQKRTPPKELEIAMEEHLRRAGIEPVE
jgi:uncharacterized protein (DUF4415 family)